jgi:hypothetical protein
MSQNAAVLVQVANDEEGAIVEMEDGELGEILEVSGNSTSSNGSAESELHRSNDKTTKQSITTDFQESTDSHYKTFPSSPNSSHSYHRNNTHGFRGRRVQRGSMYGSQTHVRSSVQLAEIPIPQVWGNR